MNFETWLNKYFEQLAHFTQMSAHSIKKMMDISELRKQFEAGEEPTQAAADEYDAWCDSV